ncbi:MAG: S-layer protein, partial [Synergistaceae bacterium]|nr:S-layer protein [Synergistaceae bacterium]
ASIIARSLAYVDFDKASKQDVEMLKRLVVEFSDELSALGVRVDELDARVAVLEKDLGGWSLAGVMEFNAKFVDDDTVRDVSGKADFDIDKYRIFLRKRIDEKTSFTARLGSSGGHENGAAGMEWEQYYITTTLPYDIEFTFGRAPIDWEGDLGLYADDDAWWGDFNRQMFKFKKDWGMANLELVFARAYDNGEDIVSYTDPDGDEYSVTAEYFLLAGLLNFDFSEKVSAGILAYYLIADDDPVVDINSVIIPEPGGGDVLTFGAYAKFQFHPSVELKGLYYYQDIDLRDADNTNAWKIILDVNQDLLKFTSLWLEYAQFEEGFWVNNQPYAVNDGLLGYIAPGGMFLEDTTVFGVRAAQQWSDKWSTWERYWVADPDDWSDAETNNFTFAVGYQYSPAIYFELAYDVLDSDGYGYDSDSLIRFQTVVNF